MDLDNAVLDFESIEDDEFTSLIQLYYKEIFPIKDIILFANDCFKPGKNYLLGPRNSEIREILRDLPIYDDYPADSIGGDREFAIKTNSNNPFYRFASVKTPESFLRILSRQDDSKNPIKEIHLGGFYYNMGRIGTKVNTPLGMKWKFDNSAKYQVDYCPLSFDFDMDSYPFRNCDCKTNNTPACSECLCFLDEIIQAFKKYLIKGFTFKEYENSECNFNGIVRIDESNLLYVFSGRRGFHLHIIGHPYTALLTSFQRNDLVKQLFYRRKHTIGDGFDSFENELTRIFIQWIIIRWKLLEKLPESFDETHPLSRACKKVNIKPDWILKKFKNGITESNFQNFTIEVNSKNRYLFCSIIHEYIGPFCDIEVTKTKGHLVKSPFSVHFNSLNLVLPIYDEFIPDRDILNIQRVFQENIYQEHILKFQTFLERLACSCNEPRFDLIYSLIYRNTILCNPNYFLPFIESDEKQDLIKKYS